METRPATSRDIISEHHKHVSEIITPRDQVDTKEKKDNIDSGPPEFPSPEYMRYIANREYLIESWNIIDTKVIYEDDKLVAIMVHGRLTWTEPGTHPIKRSGDMIGAHRIDRKRGTNELVDIGNNIKAANTDTWKKAINFYLNVCDDIYRYDYPPIPINQEVKDEIMALINDITDQDRKTEYIKILNSIDRNGINAFKEKIKYYIKYTKAVNSTPRVKDAR